MLSCVIIIKVETVVMGVGVCVCGGGGEPPPPTCINMYYHAYIVFFFCGSHTVLSNPNTFFFKEKKAQ